MDVLRGTAASTLVACAAVCAAAAPGLCGAEPLVASVGTIAADVSDDVTELDPIVVTPLPNPIDDPMLRLRTMLEDPPCKVCPESKIDPESVYVKAGKVITFFTGYGRHIPQMSHEDRLDYHLRNGWRQEERQANPGTD